MYTLIICGKYIPLHAGWGLDRLCFAVLQHSAKLQASMMSRCGSVIDRHLACKSVAIWSCGICEQGATAHLERRGCQKAKGNAVPSKAHDHSFRPYWRSNHRKKRGREHRLCKYPSFYSTEEQSESRCPGAWLAYRFCTSLSNRSNKTRVEAS